MFFFGDKSNIYINNKIEQILLGLRLLMRFESWVIQTKLYRRLINTSFFKFYIKNLNNENCFCVYKRNNRKGFLNPLCAFMMCQINQKCKWLKKKELKKPVAFLVLS
ncbi:hypothetical protein BpHYR1_007319 [Brachionus plicatilis]|uniref:Uncharacterized protein n=1 Tax=Brachionus plicatilis TaxID=10195 RepID=A0A3M7QA91_BRAPC|nr:hypothetical protein BpHYR1_007319 [Brachionus plicatilis]